jgi:hypothetical protein
MDPLTAFGFATNFVSLADVAFRLFKDVAEYYHSIKSAPAKSQELQDELLAISNVTRNLTALISNPQVGKGKVISDESLAQFRDLLNEIKAKIVLPAGKIKKRLEWPFTMKENAEYIERLERFKSTFTLALNTYQRFSP